MQEAGIDLAGQRSKGLEEVGGKVWDAVVTMGCGNACPHVPTRRHIDWDLPDPKDLPDEVFHRLRDGIHRRVADLISSLAERREAGGSREPPPVGR